MSSDSMSFESIQAVTAETELAVYGRMPFCPKEGSGCQIIDERGREYLDLYGGHAVALTGHCHPHVVGAIEAQARALIFYSSAVYSKIRAQANQALLRNAPIAGSKLFHCCSGTEANEVAFKIARLGTKRSKIISFHGSFHGRTIGSLSACGIGKYRGTSGIPLIESNIQIEFGNRADLDQIDDETAAIIVEPVQSLGGAIMVADDYYRQLAQRAHSVGAKVIFDEIQTGLGRTGTFFFADGVGVKADITTLAKGLASGVPTAAVLVEPELAGLSRGGDQGTTFGGGPIAMAALKATMEVIEAEDLVTNARLRGEQLRSGLESIDGVCGVRGRGLLIGIEFQVSARAVQQALLRHGVITGISAEPNVLRLLPPLVLKKEEADRFLEILPKALGEIE
jgi:acetylornithine/N-succinyldiaminopimelate aminotransferase